MIALFYGGSSSGKSSLAENFAVEKCENGKLCYLATMIPFGSEGERKVESHKQKREGKGFDVCEKFTDIASANINGGTVLLECVGNLVANEMFDKQGVKTDVVRHIANGIKQLSKKCENLVLVSSDISEISENLSAETLEYIKNLNEINREISKFCDEVYRVCVGIAIKEK